jgi:phospholipase D1/2
MEFQYNSINRGGHSVMELIAKAGYNPLDYIRFYNLRNYDRLNDNSAMLLAERQSGVNYEDARKQHDDALEAEPRAYGTGTMASSYNPGQQYQRYQQAAHQVAATKPYSVGSGRWDTVSECYMLGGEDLRNVPWDYPGELSEIDAFVSEELYIHSKVRKRQS